MAQNKEPDIRVLVGVVGDVGIDSGSGKLISKTLTQIAKNISAQKRPHITFDVDFQNTAKKVYKQLNEIVKSIKVEPIDLQIRTNQSSIGNSSNNAKPNVAVYTEEKQRLTDTAAQKKKDIELTRQQKKEVQFFISEVGRLNNAEKSLNTSENYANKLGKTDLLVKIPELREKVGALNVQVNELFKNSNGDKNLGDFVDTDNFKTLTENIKDANKALSDLQTLATQENPIFVQDERMANQSRDISEFALSLEKFEKANDKFKGNSGAAAEFERIKRSLADIERRSNLGETVGNDLKKLIADTNQWKVSLERAGLSGQTVFGKLRAQMEKLGVYLSASAILMGAWRQVKQMTTNVIELDTAMTELKKVTDETDATYSKFLDNAEVRAKSLGATLVDTVNATADFSRLGYSLKEAEQISNAALVYKNVGDGVRDVNAASESVISTMKAFGIEASNAMTIVDRFNEVGNNFAISSKGVGEGLKRSASALAIAGNTIDESIALMVAGNNVVQDPEVVGTFLKTAALRLTNTKGKLEELGEEAEGAAESITKLQTQMLNLTKGKVDIMLDADSFKSTYDVMLGMSEVWDTMTQKDQMEALDLMFGKKGANVGASIITNMADAEKALATSMQSSGSALSENEKVLDSIRGKAAQFQAQYEALSNTIINSDLIKFTYDSGTGLLGFLDGVIKNLGSIPTLATVAAGALSTISNKGGYAPLIKAA